MVKSDYDQVEIFLQDSTSTESAQSMMNELEGYDGVEKVEYRTKEDALNIMEEEMGREQLSARFLRREPLPNSILDHCVLTGRRRKGYRPGQ